MASRLDVSVRSYYDYRNGIHRKCSLQRAINEQIVSKSFELFDNIYGVARISPELSLTDTPLSKTTVAKYMQGLGLKSRLRRKYRVYTTNSNHNNPVVPNLLDRDFTASGMKWVSV